VLEGRKEGRWGDLVVLYYFAFPFLSFPSLFWFGMGQPFWEGESFWLLGFMSRSPNNMHPLILVWSFWAWIYLFIYLFSMWVVWVCNLDPFICNIVSIHTYLLRYPFLLCGGTGFKLFNWGFLPCDSGNKLSAWWKALIWFSLDFYMFCFGCSWRDW